MERLVKEASFKSFFISMFGNNIQQVDDLEESLDYDTIDEKTKKELQSSNKRIKELEKFVSDPIEKKTKKTKTVSAKISHAIKEEKQIKSDIDREIGE